MDILPDRDRVMILIPCKDRVIDLGCVRGIGQCMDYFSYQYVFAGSADIALTRNLGCHHFVEDKPQFDWLMMIDSDIEFDLSDWLTLWQGDEDIVTAEYSKKQIGAPPARMGLGFTRVHRRVFEKIRDYTYPDGTELAPKFYLEGRCISSYFTAGPTRQSRWMGEDHSLFMRAGVIEASYRIETNTRLRHIGPFAYHYPQQIPDFAAATGQGAN